MLGTLLTMVDHPLTIDNPGLFFFMVALYAILLALFMAWGMITLRDGVEELVEVEAYQTLYSEQTQRRFRDILDRAYLSFEDQREAHIHVLGFASA